MQNECDATQDMGKGKKVKRFIEKKRNNYNLYEETTHDQGESAISTNRRPDILRT